MNYGEAISEVLKGKKVTRHSLCGHLELSSIVRDPIIMWIPTKKSEHKPTPHFPTRGDQMAMDWKVIN